MAGLDPAIPVYVSADAAKTRMPGSNPGMTGQAKLDFESGSHEPPRSNSLITASWLSRNSTM